eukprot:TRINITY_DN57058_c0_g1_i1.p1 TRINITY_DN57058_c0_g1~~TRINITY_DN57058_c0_g1_i1.p1  ORF type:complete len:146 (+),score=14.07 TRINITY_DN57058_c0_g1_i1:39-440(+)
MAAQACRAFQCRTCNGLIGATSEVFMLRSVSYCSEVCRERGWRTCDFTTSFMSECGDSFAGSAFCKTLALSVQAVSAGISRIIRRLKLGRKKCGRGSSAALPDHGAGTARGCAARTSSPSAGAMRRSVSQMEA